MCYTPRPTQFTPPTPRPVSPAVRPTPRPVSPAVRPTPRPVSPAVRPTPRPVSPAVRPTPRPTNEPPYGTTQWYWRRYGNNNQP